MSAFPYPHPQPTNNALTFGDSIGNDVSVTIYTKQRWADPWVADATLDLLQVSWNAAPNIPTATIRYRYGRVLEQGATVETTRTKKTWLGHYVKILAVCSDGNRVWHGFVDDLADEQGGLIPRTIPGDPPTIAAEAHGVQTLSCVGMIGALDRAPIERTYHRVGADFAIAGNTTRVAWSAPQFNVSDNKALENVSRFGGFQIAKTRTTTTEVARGFGIQNQDRNIYVHRFPGLYGITATTTADAWRLGDVLENLVALNAPRVGVGSDFAPLADVQDPDDFKTAYVPVWIFDHDVLNPPNTTTQFADWFLPRFDAEGLTLKGALDRLLAPQNGHGYWVWVDETTTPNRLYVEPFTTITLPATIQDETGTQQTFPANTRVVNLTAATDSATAISVQTNGAQQYTALVVEGAPKIVVFTIDTANQLEPAWPQALEDAYNAEIAGLNPAIMRQLQRMRDIRELPRYQPIGRHWRIKHTYNWQDSTPAVNVFQYTETNADPGFNFGKTDYYPFGLRLRLLSDLPFREGIDYAAADTAAVRTAHESARTPWRRVEVYAKTHESDATLTGKWICWSTKAVRDVLYDPNDPSYGITAKELTNQMAVGLEIEVTGGYQGALAAGGGRVAPHVPKIDPAELRITVAAQSDQRAQVIKRNPATVTQPAGQTPGTVNIDADRVKTIRLGERFQSVVVMKDTIVAATDAGPVTVPARFTLRDDTPLATQFAEFAANYYFQPRAIVRVVSRRATAKLWPGQIIGTVNANTTHAATCNAQISEVALTMGVGVDGNYTAPTFTVQTSFGELDPLQFFPKLSGG